MTTTEQSRTAYGHREMQAKWQQRWENDGIYKVLDDDPRPKWYELHMYPYPSGDLHIGTGSPCPAPTPAPDSCA